tara:strand:+ start:412 stop:1461 length:1050 start_codon:yes stop_codon:yes gene_type:complete
MLGAMKIYDLQRDLVIRSVVLTGIADYDYALENLYPLIDRFEEQRKIQRPKFYERLKRDILSGCIMPAITLAFVDEEISTEENKDKVVQFVKENIASGYVLDGMQRLNTLVSASEDEKFDRSRPIFLNVIIAEKYDLLLYRMITLNNGQKPMTVRHQVEMLTNNLINGLVDSGVLHNIKILTEKELQVSSPKGSFRKVDIASAYLAFLTGGPHNQNSRFIEDKLDEILVGKIMESEITFESLKFSDVISHVDRVSEDETARDWLRNENNLIGFTLGLKKSFNELNDITPVQFGEMTKVFDEAFLAINPSKVNVGKVRRELSLYFVSNVGKLVGQPVEVLTEELFDLTAT